MIGELCLFGLGLYAAKEVTVAFGTRRAARRHTYARALSQSRRLGVPLLVIGDPDTGWVTKHFGRDYGCGDVCTDMSGCPRCPVRVQGPLEAVLPRFAARSHVVFECLTLEYVDDLPLVIRELERVAVPGGLHTVRIEPGSSTPWLHTPSSKWEISSTRPWRFRRRR